MMPTPDFNELKQAADLAQPIVLQCVDAQLKDAVLSSELLALYTLANKTVTAYLIEVEKRCRH